MPGDLGQEAAELEAASDPGDSHGPAAWTAGAAAGSGAPGAAAFPRRVCCVSRLTWGQPALHGAGQQKGQGQLEQQPGQGQLEQQEGRAPELVVQPLEGFLGQGCRFDAAAVQEEVRQQHPQLEVELQRLRGSQAQGTLPAPEQLNAAAPAAGACRQNQVAPPPPPPLPPPPAPMQRFLAQPHSAVRNGMLPLDVQQQQQQQQPRIMRPLYRLSGPPTQVLALAQQLPQPARDQQACAALSAFGQLPAAHAGPGQPPAAGVRQAGLPAGSAHTPWPAPLQAPEEDLASNKRAADVLKARLLGGKRQKAPGQADCCSGVAGGDAAGATRLVAPQGLNVEEPDKAEGRGCEEAGWLRGAPACIRQLAADGGAAPPELLFLGTGSAEPSKYRGASAIQLRCSPAAPHTVCLPPLLLLLVLVIRCPCHPLVPANLLGLPPGCPMPPPQAALRAEHAAGLRRGRAGGAAQGARRRRPAAPGGQPGVRVGVAPTRRYD
jgi:hypothetical protein